MRKRRFKRLAVWVNGIIASLFVIPGITTICTDINGDFKSFMAAHATEAFYYAEFTSSIFDESKGDLVYAELVARAKEECKISVEYETYSVNAIEGLDYVGTTNVEEFEFIGEGEIKRKIAFKSNLTDETKENTAVSNRLRRWSWSDIWSEEDQGMYHRHFKVKITQITISDEAGTRSTIYPQNDDDYKNSQNWCFVYLPYKYVVQTEFDLTSYKKYGAEKNDSKYVVMSNPSGGVWDVKDFVSEGPRDLDGKKTWKNWTASGNNSETGMAGVDSYTTTNYIESGLMKAYGTILIDSIDNSTWHSNSDIHVLMGDGNFMANYDSYGRSKDIPGLGLYIKVDPDKKGGYHLNGAAMNYLAQGKDPTSKEDRLVHVPDGPTYFNSDRKQLNVKLGSSADEWVGTPGALYNTTFFRLKPYNGKIELGLAVYNSNKEVDIDAELPYSYVKFVDDTAPYIVDECVEYSKEGNLRLYIRFSEAVAPRYEKPIVVTANDISYQATFKDGICSDTLVYEVSAAALERNHQKIKTISYILPQKDIADLSYTYDDHGTGMPNLLPGTDGSEEERTRTARILGEEIDLSIPRLGANPSSSEAYQNSYDIILSANSTAASRDFTEGTVYYTWDTTEKWSTLETPKDPTLPSSYDYSHILTEEENGSFQVGLNNVAPGSYYLHALAMPKNGGKNPEIDYKTFGPYNFDNTSFTSSLTVGKHPQTEEASTLKTKFYSLDIPSKATSGSPLDTIEMFVEYYDSNNVLQTRSQTIARNGSVVVDSKLAQKIGNTFYYYSNVDENRTATPTIPLDPLIKDLLTDTVQRLDATVYFVITDKAGNSSVSNILSSSYDKRTTFEETVSFPDSYTKHSFDGIPYDVYKYTTETPEAITFSIDSATTREYVTAFEATYSLTVNGEEVFAEGIETSISLTLEPGIYNIVPRVYGGTKNVNQVSDNIYFCLSRGLDDMTTNRQKTQEDLVLNNKTYQLQDVKYYYYVDSTNRVNSFLYGATIDPSTGKYDGGSAYPTFSANENGSASSDAAKKYIKYMEMQDMHLIYVTDLIATALNGASTSTAYVKAEGEKTVAQPGQLWIRYKRSTWNNSSDPYNWACYFYSGSGEVSNGINTSLLSQNLQNAINTVTNRIVSNGAITYLVEEDTLSPSTNAPYLRPVQMHVQTETATTTMCGTKIANKLQFEGDKALYKNSVQVLGNSYPLATNLVLDVGDLTTIYYQYYGDVVPSEEPSSWTKLNIYDGALLGSLFGDRGIYHIREFDEKGVSTYNVYIDHEQPVIRVYTDDDKEHQFNLPDDSAVVNFSSKKFTINKLTDTDDLAYVAIYKYPNMELIDVLYSDYFSNGKTYQLSNGNYAVQVGDRSGNITTYYVIASDSEFILNAAENADKTAVIVTVLNRTEKEIYSYQIFLNGELLDVSFAERVVLRDPGIYRIVVRDIYGNERSKTVYHEAPTPNLVWYYYVGDRTVEYDPDHISRMELIEDESNPRITYVYASTRVRINIPYVYGYGDIGYELTGVTEGEDYTFYEPITSQDSVLIFNNLKSWKLRIWYENNPESDRIYIFIVDNNAPQYSGNFIGTSYYPKVELDSEGNVIRTSNFSLIDWSKYPHIGDIITLDYLDYEIQGETTLKFENGDTISGTQIKIYINDDSGVENVSVTRNGEVISNPRYDPATGVLSLNGYGEFTITASDKFNNVSTFSFTNVETGLTRAYVDDSEDEIEENTTFYGHDSLTVKTFAQGTFLVLITYDDKSYTYEFRYNGASVVYGRYVRDDEVLSETRTIPVAEYQEATYSLIKNECVVGKWYKVFSTSRYGVEASFDSEGNVYYRINCLEDNINVETRFSVNNDKLPSHFVVDLSKKVSDIVIYSGGQEIEKGESYYIHVSNTLTIKTTGTDVDIINVKYSFHPYAISHEYTTIYDGSTWSSFIGETNGYYQIIVTNKYNNVTTYNLKKIDTFGWAVMIQVVDGSEVYYHDQRKEAYSNNKLQLIIMSDAVSFVVNGEKRPGIYRQDATVLTLEVQGVYYVDAVGDNGIKESFYFEIKKNDSFVYKDEWITGFNQKALLKDEAYTNTKCTVVPMDGVAYIDVSVNGELHKLYDAINAQPQLKTETLEEVMTECGDATYTVGFRNKYGDLVKKAIYYSSTANISLDRKTTNDPNTYESYDLGVALEKGFYSNYVLRFSTNSRKYKFTINGEEYTLEEPRVIEFSNISGTGSFSYKITFLDEYGNDISFDAILYRDNVSIDLSKMNIITVGNDQYTKDDIIVNFDSKLNGVVSVNDGEFKRYISGTAFYADGKYTFTVTDIAGNHVTYTINHKSVNHYTLTDPNNNDNEVITDGVVNHSSVRFSSSDGSNIKYVFKNGEQLSEFSGSVFSSTGHWELIIEDAIGNRSYESFYIINNELAIFDYTAPYGYVVSEVWRVINEDSRDLLPDLVGSHIVLNENGSYVVVVSNSETTSSFNFTVTINDTPPTATLVGAENGGVTARDVRLTGLKSGDVVKVYKNGELVEVTTVSVSLTGPTINTSGSYRIEVTNVQGVTTEYEFTRKPIASASASVFIIITCVIAMAGLTFGLIYHTKLKTDE